MQKPSAILKLYKKITKKYQKETISLLSLPGNSVVLTHMQHKVRQLVSVFLQICVVQHTKWEPGVAGSTSDGGWGAGW